MLPPVEERYVEVQVDALVAPTHCHIGMAPGNFHATAHEGKVSNPRKAFVECLDKAKLVADLGVPQIVLPPHERPHLRTLSRLGFKETEAEMLEHAYRVAPEMLYAACASSHMWMANAATVTPDVDSTDNMLHFTPANLRTLFHRSIEAEFTGELLEAVFGSVATVHHPLPSHQWFGDEGAANHQRFSSRGHWFGGAHLFVYGSARDVDGHKLRVEFPRRQSREASEAIARRHGIQKEDVFFVRQNAHAINAGVFHNDVISAHCADVWFLHESSYTDTHALVGRVEARLRQKGLTPNIFIVTYGRLTLTEAVESYVFNSQLVALRSGNIAVIASGECAVYPKAQGVLREFQERTESVEQIFFIDVKESVQNGGGPACLRLRVPMREQDLGRIYDGVYLTPMLYYELREVGERLYRDRLTLDDLRDPELLKESRQALEEFSNILGFGSSLYDFQRL